MPNIPAKFDFCLSIGPQLNAIYLTDVAEGVAEMLCLDSVDQIGFKYIEISDGQTASLEISSGEAGNVKHVMTFVLACAARFQLRGLVSFTWSPAGVARGASGNGACVIDLDKREIVDIIDLQEWVNEKVRSEPHSLSGLIAGLRRLVISIRAQVQPFRSADIN